MHLSKGYYTSDNSYLIVEVIKVRYQTEEKVKFKGRIYNKVWGYCYEEKNYNLPKERILHWIKLPSTYSFPCKID